MSGNEENEADVVMRTEIVVAIKDSAQPTMEEIKEFESFNSKSWSQLASLHTVGLAVLVFYNSANKTVFAVRALSQAGHKGRHAHAHGRREAH